MATVVAGLIFFLGLAGVGVLFLFFGLILASMYFGNLFGSDWDAALSAIQWTSVAVGMQEAERDLRRWSRGGIHIDVPEDRQSLLGASLCAVHGLATAISAIRVATTAKGIPAAACAASISIYLA